MAPAKQSEAYMEGNVGFFCKSYRDDFSPLGQLLETFSRHNPSDLKLTLSLPASDVSEFCNTFGRNISNLNLVADQSYCDEDLRTVPGWYGQQICKLMSWRVMKESHYAVVDSDCYFIRDAMIEDLQPANNAQAIAFVSRIRTVLKEGNADLIRYIKGELPTDFDYLPPPPRKITDRLSEFVHYKDLPQEAPNAIERSDIPMKAFGRSKWLYCQPGQIFSGKLLKKLCTHFETHGLTARQAIQISPWEYNWYGEYAASFGYAETEFRVSPFVHFQEARDLEFARENNINEEVLRGKFLLIQMAARHLSDLRL
jgi:hypothetical protein